MWINFLIPILLFLFQGEPQKITVSYAALSCSCAQWKMPDGEHIYLERANAKLPDAHTLWDGENLPLVVAVTGTFRNKPGWPKGLKFKGNPEPAKVFVYDKIETLQP
ncbi:hypothetical protein [Flavobacterium sp.]|uniref:hypothetical protein n=1 Tax=Flavobacterium sp. TaxID=239 RepID=UPI0039E65A54